MVRASRRRVSELVDPGTEDRWGRRLTAAVVLLASLNVVALVLQSVPAVYRSSPRFFSAFSFGSVLLFTLLYALRVWSVTASANRRDADGRLRFVRSPIAVVDVVVLTLFWGGLLWEVLWPTTVPSVFGAGAVRVLWLAHVFELPQLKRSRRRFKRVLLAQREDLAIAFSGAGMLVLVSSTLMYFAERGAQPDAFSSIPAALWWGVVTLTTVGYGDVIPVTPLGRLLGAITTFGGIAFFALPSSVLAAGFFSERTAEREGTTEDGRTCCPHCGKSLHSAAGGVRPALGSSSEDD
ncbi:potassium channel family protein [Halobium salinum]|uniref:Potassium channel family protein n=1 Tax=Halobium salinum TaxID=1364940 RepID=A0ABD5PHG9_9EURY|nr:potassium channel family protein [Halobium salinum]